jgi:hypothetical protein
LPFKLAALYGLIIWALSFVYEKYLEREEELESCRNRISFAKRVHSEAYCPKASCPTTICPVAPWIPSEQLIFIFIPMVIILFMSFTGNILGFAVKPVKS